MNCNRGDRCIAVQGPAAGVMGDVVGGGFALTQASTGRTLSGWLVAFDVPIDWGDGRSSTAPDECEGWYPDAWLRRVTPGQPLREHAVETWGGLPA